MKKGKLLNSELSYAVSRLGHTDSVVIADAGLPIPAGPQRIDLALTAGVPGFLQVVDVVTQEMQVERAIIAREMEKFNPSLHARLAALLAELAERQGNIIGIDYVSHEEFKALSGTSRAVVRSGECSPFANVILCAGVTF